MTKRVPAKSPSAARAAVQAQELQAQFVQRLEDVASRHGADQPFQPSDWLRDEGRHGGGTRLGTQDSPLFDRASINFSQVQYDDDPAKKLASATALSCIVHPRNPHAPSMHMHISWTELRDGRGSWRVMADLNPSIADESQAQRFADSLRAAAPDHYEGASAQGDRYFFIPVLNRHRGITHFYLEGFASSDPEADALLAREVGSSTIDTYAKLLEEGHAKVASSADRDTQLAYHTLYLFQVLTLDRGTSSGLLVHDQNDVGVLGSLPGTVDRELLQSWRTAMPEPQELLLDRILDALPEGQPCPVGVPEKRVLAQAVREHYRSHPEALALQASGDVLPPTVDNHR